MGEYIRRRHNKFAQFIATQLIMDLCEDIKRTPGVKVGIQCWEQASINLTGNREGGRRRT